MRVVPVCARLGDWEGVDLGLSGFYGALCDFTGTVFERCSPFDLDILID